MKTGSKIAIAVFSMVAILHLFRIVYAFDMTIDSWFVPMWVSVLGVIGPTVIAVLLWRESK